MTEFSPQTGDALKEAVDKCLKQDQVFDHQIKKVNALPVGVPIAPKADTCAPGAPIDITK